MEQAGGRGGGVMGGAREGDSVPVSAGRRSSARRAAAAAGAAQRDPYGI